MTNKATTILATTTVARPEVVETTELELAAALFPDDEVGASETITDTGTTDGEVCDGFKLGYIDGA